MSKSYQFKIDPKSRKAVRFINKVQKEIQKAYVLSGKKQIDIAKLLDIDKSEVHRRLKGNANLTVRSVAEMAYALNVEILFSLEPHALPVSGVNHHPLSIPSIDDTTRDYAYPKSFSTAEERSELALGVVS